MSVFDPIRPYAELVKWIAGVIFGLVLVSALFFGGRAVGVASMQDEVNAKAEALNDAAASLRGCATSLNSVNAQAEADIQQAKDAAKAAEDARKVAEGESARLAKQAQAREDEFDRRLRIAQRRPECKALLDTDVRQQCGF